MAKDRNGQVKPHNLGGSRFKDGSLRYVESCDASQTQSELISNREDIPLGSLHTQFNCNFSIVSQTNPHIHLFFFAPRGSVGRPVANRKGKGAQSSLPWHGESSPSAGWRGGFILSALESYIKLDLSKHFKVRNPAPWQVVWNLTHTGHSRSRPSTANPAKRLEWCLPSKVLRRSDLNAEEYCRGMCVLSRGVSVADPVGLVPNLV